MNDTARSKAIEQAGSVEDPKGHVIAFRGALKPSPTGAPAPRIRIRRSTWQRFIDWILWRTN